jgi:hypothetical protein
VSFQLHPEARNEFREAVLFYGRAAERFVNAVETAIAAIILIGAPRSLSPLDWCGAHLTLHI